MFTYLSSVDPWIPRLPYLQPKLFEPKPSARDGDHSILVPTTQHKYIYSQLRRATKYKFLSCPSYKGCYKFTYKPISVDRQQLAPDKWAILSRLCHANCRGFHSYQQQTMDHIRSHVFQYVT